MGEPKMLAFMLVVTAIVLLSVCVYRAVVLGRRVAAQGQMHLAEHKRVVNHTLAATLFLVLTIETLSHLSTVHMTGSWIFILHLFFAIPFVVLLIVLRVWANGVLRRRLHAPLAYTATVCFGGVLITGVVMLATLMTAG